MPYVIDLTLPLKTVAGLNAREHHLTRASRVRKERAVAANALSERLARRSGIPCTVTLTRVSPGTLDDDNLQGALKAVRDGVADALKVDDADPRVRWQYAQAKCPRGSYRVLVNVWSQKADCNG